MILHNYNVLHNIISCSLSISREIEDEQLSWLYGNFLLYLWPEVQVKFPRLRPLTMTSAYFPYVVGFLWSGDFPGQPEWWSMWKSSPWSCSSLLTGRSALSPDLSSWGQSGRWPVARLACSVCGRNSHKHGWQCASTPAILLWDLGCSGLFV